MLKNNAFGVKINISMTLPDVRDCAKFLVAASLCISKHFMAVSFLTRSVKGFYIERVTFSWQASMLICS
jgi:hypothetical protein